MKTALLATVLGLAVLLSGEAVYGSDIASSSPIPAIATQTGTPIVLAQYSDNSSSTRVRIPRGAIRLAVGAVILVIGGVGWVIKQMAS
ncbi:MAG: hypothetical protein MUF06_01650 [Pirellulaceae bacterium]|nr:hypothetical protein [Pirellulaceae bacterium]